MRTILPRLTLIAVSSFIGASATVDATLSKVSANAYLKLPMSFELNSGQSKPEIKFTARGSGYTVFLTASTAIISLKRSQQPEVLRMGLVGAARNPSIVGRDRLPSTVNYYRGSDRTKWLSGIPTYAKVDYESVYPKIDLVYYGNQGSLEYDFWLRPGSDPGVIALQFDGASNLSVNTRGDLFLQTKTGGVGFRKPIIYQTLADGNKTPIAGGYRMLSKNRIGFWVGHHDHSRVLVIDPVLEYGSYFGGIATTTPGATGTDAAYGIALDPLGNAIMTGLTSSDTLPTTSGMDNSLGSYHDAFVAKLNSSGTALVYATYLGGNYRENIYGKSGIAVDNEGNAYITGYTESTSFPQTTISGAGIHPCATLGGDAFVTKLDPLGNLIFSVCFGGWNNDIGTDITVDSSGRAHVVGFTYSSESRQPIFPKINYQQGFGGGFTDAFLAIVNSAGTALESSTYLGGTGADQANGVAVDSMGNTWVVGKTTGGFPVANRVTQFGVGGGVSDIFIAEYDVAGGLSYADWIGGSGDDQGNAVAVDYMNNVHITGFTNSPPNVMMLFPTTVNALQATPPGGGDAFFTTLSSDHTTILQSNYLGGWNTDIGHGIKVDTSGNVYIAGSTYSPNFPKANAIQQAIAPAPDAFVTKINPTGTGYVYSTFLGGNGPDEARAIAIDNFGNAYIAGFSKSTNFPVTPGAVQTACSGTPSQCASGGDAMIAKISGP